MRLKEDETRKLIEATDGQPLLAVINDACEMLTLKVVLLLKARKKAIEQQRKALPLGDPEANVLAAKMRAIGELMVEIAEAP